MIILEKGLSHQLTSINANPHPYLFHSKFTFDLYCVIKYMFLSETLIKWVKVNIAIWTIVTIDFDISDLKIFLNVLLHSNV